MLIDGVFSGGGIKGFALVGAYQMLEQKGYQFERLAGTSAGAIIACLIAAGYNGLEIEKLLDELDTSTLRDEKKTLLNFPFMKWAALYWKMGLYEGKVLENWLLEKLLKKGVYSFADLQPNQLKIVASDITNGKLIVFPTDLASYGLSANHFPVARAVRMSAGIPFFYQPMRLSTKNKASIVVDAGLLSNFPMWLMTNEKEKRKRPLLGIKLAQAKGLEKQDKIQNALQLFEAIFSTMRNAYDNEHIPSAYEKDIVFIPVKDIKATDFSLSKDDKNALLALGRSSMEKFLRFW